MNKISKWELIVSKLDLPSTRMLLLQQAKLESFDSDKITILLSPNWANLIINRKKLIENAVKKTFGDHVNTKFITAKKIFPNPLLSTVTPDTLPTTEKKFKKFNKYNITPIPTKYNGVEFKSRLEARWAVFFDYLNIHWEYEPEGFKLDNKNNADSYYCPDFLIRTPQGKDMWVEIKPHNIKQSDKFDKFKKLIKLDRVYLLSGQPSDVLKNTSFCPRCGSFEVETTSERMVINEENYQIMQDVYCWPCDTETPSGGGHSPDFQNICKIPITPHKGFLQIEKEDYLNFAFTVSDACDFARTFDFYPPRRKTIYRG